MTRLNALRSPLFLLLTCLAAAPASANPGAICLGAARGDARVGAEEAVVFKNAASRATRIRFDEDAAPSMRCRVDGRSVRPSWSNQYRLRPGSSLSCRMSPGSYPYVALVPARSGVHREHGRVEVRAAH